MKIWKQKSFGMSTNRWSRISDFPKRRCLITTVLIWRETIQMLRRSHLKVSVKDASKVASSWLIYVTSTKPGNWSHFLNKTISGGRNCDVLKRKNRIFLVRDYQTNIVRHHAMKRDVLDAEIMPCSETTLIMNVWQMSSVPKIAFHPQIYQTYWLPFCNIAFGKLFFRLYSPNLHM